MPVQRIFSYLKHNLEFGIWYSASSSLDLVGFSDADFAAVGLIKRAFLVLVIFSDLLLFVGILANSFLLHSPPPRPCM
jgi:hypothetical protein